MIRIFRYLKKKEVAFILISLVFIVGQVWLDLKLPDYMKDITVLIQKKNTELADVLKPGFKMLGCAFGSLALSCIVGFFAAKVAAGFANRLRSKTFSSVQNFSMEEINKFSTASLITRSTNDITQIQMFIAMGLQVLIKAPILAVWAIMKILNKGWQWTAATGGAVGVLCLIILFILIFAVPKFKIVQNLTDNLNRVTRENLTGIRVVRAYNAENYQQNKFEDANQKLTATNLFVNRVMAIMMPGMSLIMSGLSLSIYWIGAYIINSASTMPDKGQRFADMVVFSSYAVQVVIAFMMMTMIFIIAPRAAVSAKRINEVLDTKCRIINGSKTQGLNGSEGCIEFRNVSFKYPDASDYTLSNISFTAKKGETVAFIGATGSGKTTLVNLIPRFYDVTEGDVLVDGVNVREYAKESLNDRIGYVSQKAVLFSGTVASNVAYGENGKNSYSENDVKKAVEIAQGTEFVEKMPDTFNASIAQGGNNVSGGQKQRIAIARAVCRKPEIYIFDDSFSALDYKTDKVLRAALKRETANTTSIIVAQRIGTIKNADKIIVLDDGKIAGSGTHSQLMKNCEIYREIALSQLSKEELEND